MAISVYYQNVRGLKTKTNDNYNSFLSSNFDIVCMAETWLNGSIISSELFDDRYCVVRRDRCNRFFKRFNKQDGGGILMAISKNLNFINRTDWRSDLVEDLWIQITNSKKELTINICIVYLPDYLPIELYQDFVTNCKRILHSYPYDKTIILGDFNLGEVVWSNDKSHIIKHNCDKSNALSDLFQFEDVTQLNTILNHNQRLLDLAITNSPELFSLISTPALSRLDAHHPSFEVTFVVQASLLDINRSVCNRLCFYKTDIEGCMSELAVVDWDHLASIHNCDDFLHAFYNIVHETIEKYTPRIRTKSTRYPVWFSRGLIVLIQNKQKYHNRFKRHGNPRDYDTFSMLRLRVKAVLEQCLRVYIERIESDLSVNIKAFWRYTRGKRVTNSYPKLMRYNDRKAENGCDIVNLFADYFSSVYGAQNNVTYTPEFPHCNLSIFNITLSSDIVLKQLKHIDLSKGPGPDGIPPVFICLCASVLVKPLTIIYNMSLSSGVFPSLWKIAKITPVHKSGDRADVTNYRPICILSWFAKIFESLVYTHLYSHFKHLLSPNQHGFISGRSTCSNLLSYVTYLCDAFNDKCQVDAIYLDFSKAFDRVNHMVLLSKLDHLGIHGSLHRWITSYLMNRSQLVALSGFESVPFLALSGVPQGSNLGPLLFLTFVNDLLGLIQCECLAYADDVKIFHRIYDMNDCLTLQSNLDTIENWCNHNYMALNAKKCQVITFTKNKKPLNYAYGVGGGVLDRVNVVRDLGVMFDSVLSFRPHYDHICNNANRLLSFLLRNTKPFRNAASLVILYNALVRSILEYCSPIWYPIYDIHVDRIESVQRRFARCLSSKYGLRRKLPNYSERLCRFKMMSLEDRRRVSDLCTLHRIVNSTMDSQLIEHLKFRVPTRSVRIPQLFSLPPMRNNVSQNGPLYRICRLYNDLCSRHDIFSNSIMSFKAAMYSSCNRN